MYKIQNRRYLGNKFKLLPFIQGVVEDCKNIDSVADLFAGTGVVSSLFVDRTIITNDLLYSNYICNLAFFGSEPINNSKLEEIIAKYNIVDSTSLHPNYMTDNFADTYFSRDDCTKIGFIREDIEKQFQTGRINNRERAVLITSLIYSMDRIAKTCGHYDAYRRGVEFDTHLKLDMLEAPETNPPQNQCYNEDANKLVRQLYADLVYLDPPYNSRQYSDCYHLLENVARWQKPKVFGVARKLDRTGIKSDYCTSKAVHALTDLVENIQARYILFSYNNMASKGDARSNARISDTDIISILRRRGRVSVFSQGYRAFNAGKSDIQENEERLFLCEIE